MGILDFIRGQLIEVIEWRDDTNDTIVHKFEDKECDIKMGAQLTVRESQVAVFINEGQQADIFGPGRYELTTANMPLLTVLKSWKYGFNSPFKVDIFFVNTKQFINQKWGTANPIMMRDKEFGMIRARAFGVFSFKVEDAGKFIKEVSGTNSTYTVGKVVEHMRSQLVSGVSDGISESKIAALDLASNYDELSNLAQNKIAPKLSALGMKLVEFIIENISLPEEVEKVMDKRTSMGVLGDLNKYTQYQAAEALRDAAQNPSGGGGIMGAGVGMGAGVQMGQIMANAMSGANQANQASSAPTVACVGCSQPIPVGTKFCPHCGAAQGAKCVKCGANIERGAKFCQECGAAQSLKCSCGQELAAGAKFCPNCGKTQG